MNQDKRIKQLERELQAKQYIINCLGNEFVDLIEEAAEAERDLNIALAEIKMYKDRIEKLEAQLAHNPPTHEKN